MSNIYDTASGVATIGGINLTIGSTVFFAENWSPSHSFERLDIPGEDNKVNGHIWSGQPRSFSATLLATDTGSEDVLLGEEFTAKDHNRETKTWIVEEVSSPQQVGTLWKYEIAGIEKITPAALTAPS